LSKRDTDEAKNGIITLRNDKAKRNGGVNDLPKTGVGVTVIRKEACEKVTGGATYAADFLMAGVMTARLATSTCAHGIIRSVDTSEAEAVPGVRAVLTGDSVTVRCGSIIEDRPPLARERVRYYGEPIALVVAENAAQAAKAASLVKAEYELLSVIHSPGQALEPGAFLIHEHLGSYKTAVPDVYPEPGTNICHREKVRKGDAAQGFKESAMIVEGRFALPQSDHIAMETRAAEASISADGTVRIRTSSQAPFEVQKLLSSIFQLEESKVIVEVPLVGGAFGGKAAVTLEILAYLASKAVGGRPVRLVSTREEDVVSSPCRMGLEAVIRLGAANDGELRAAEMIFLVDSGGYADIGPRLSKAVVVGCTGPYGIENVSCDSLCVYTNHPYATSFRGFSHESVTFCFERMMDKLARKLRMDPAALRYKNALVPGRTSPTQVKITESNCGNPRACIERVKMLIHWEEGDRLDIGGNKIRSKGIAAFWKTSNSPPDAISGAFIVFNTDGSISLNCGCAELGPMMKTTAAQILSEALKMDLGRIHVNMGVNTEYSPRHWKTVASMTTFMLGRAVIHAAEDAAVQLKSMAAVVMRCAPEDLDIEEERVYLRSDPTVYQTFKDLVHGYHYENGNAFYGPVLGRGGFIMNDLNYLDRDTGSGKPGPYWTVGAQAVEVEYDAREHTYRLVRAATVIDAGKVINPAMAEALVKGGMCMGFGLGSREYFQFDPAGRVLDTSLRTYKVMHFGQTPEYLVEFVETPFVEGPYGARGLGEHGIVGIPAALANALSVAAGCELDELPVTPEKIWLAKSGGKA
jgi:CO/xanthine dehydrogenase Mo-binding subunit